ncbi:putative glutamate--tRNA ligase, cytoplasmic [Astathelohania contejeani]|uniref:glutamate--tRNA ligase n=1 Tax=Astathelohania contejeani TaxID=164912 RepID=A0ABQ7HZY9_9MICR|nr:putative glutamate--tRNA ligase, cytoplasmic [Thelohania contejeani]
MTKEINHTDKFAIIPFLIYSKSNEEIKFNDKSKPFTIQDIEVPEDILQDIIKNWNLKASYQELESALNQIEPLIKNTHLQDMLFALFQSNGIFLNLFKKGILCTKFPAIFEFYTHKLKENKQELENFQKIKSAFAQKAKDQGTFAFDISGPDTVTRFPPEPSGYLHIGHAKAALLNQHFGSKLRVRFDDTNQNKEYEKYEPIILEDLRLLNITDYDLSNTSDYFEQIIKLAKILIKKGLAYCDDTGLEIMRAERDEGKESKRRNTPVEENEAIFEDMLKGKREEYCLRAKIDYKDPNKAMRDPVIMRHNKKTHHKTGRKYNIYPTYDFACPIVDSLEGVTNALRTNEFRDRNIQYKWFLDALEMKNKPKINEFGRLNFENTVLSKRKLLKFIDQGLVSGWDDPRVPTIRGILRLGLRIDVLKEYILMQGTSQKNCTASWDKIWALNKKKIDPISPRYSCVLDPIPAFIENCNDSTASILLHKKNSNLGQKKVNFDSAILLSKSDALLLAKGEEFTLMNWGNAIVKDIIYENGNLKELRLQLHLEGDFKTTKNKFNWVSNRGSVKIKAVEYGSLVTEVSTEEDLTKFFNKNSKMETNLIGEQAVENIKKGDIVQFERMGFYYCDSPGVFHLIPFTKQTKNI